MEDEQLGTSGSIANQLKLLEDYACANGFTPTIRLSEMITSSLIQSHYKGAKPQTPKDHVFQAFFVFRAFLESIF
jgi:hypothetical protein